MRNPLHGDNNSFPIEGVVADLINNKPMKIKFVVNYVIVLIILLAFQI